MSVVLELQKSLGPSNEVPVTAALFTSGGEVLCVSANAVEELADPTAHAEIQCLRFVLESALRGSLPHLTLAVTLEPCPMCAWTIGSMGVGVLVFGAYNDRYGAAGSKYDLVHDASLGRTQVFGGLHADKCSENLKSFFLSIR